MTEKAHEIVLLPGLDGTGDLFQRIVPLLERDARVTVVRYPRDPALDYAGYAQFVREAVGARPVVLLGESFSGPIAVSVAAQCPEQVLGVVLVVTFLRRPWPAWLLRLVARVDPRSAPRLVRDLILIGKIGKKRDEALAALVADVVGRLDPQVRARRIGEVARVDVRDRFNRLNCPILVLLGANDWLVWKAPLERAAAAKPNAEIAVLPAAHMLLQTCHRAAASHIQDWLKRL